MKISVEAPVREQTNSGTWPRTQNGGTNGGPDNPVGYGLLSRRYARSGVGYTRPGRSIDTSHSIVVISAIKI